MLDEAPGRVERVGRLRLADILVVGRARQAAQRFAVQVDEAGALQVAQHPGDARERMRRVPRRGTGEVGIKRRLAGAEFLDQCRRQVGFPRIDAGEPVPVAVPGDRTFPVAGKLDGQAQARP